MFLPRPTVVTTRPAPLVAPPAARRSWPGRVAAAPMALIAGFTAVIVAGTLPWLGDRPTLGPPEPVPPRVLAKTTLYRYRSRLERGAPPEKRACGNGFAAARSDPSVGGRRMEAPQGFRK